MVDEPVAVWVYGVCGADFDSSSLVEATGVDAEPIRLVRTPELAAVVGAVGLSRFGEEALGQRLNNLDELEQIARRHHHVVRLAAGYQPVAPARVATLYADDSGVRAALQRHREVFLSALGRVRGRKEWGVKAYHAPGPVAATAQPTGPVTGTSYLRQRQAALAATDASHRAGADSALALHERLAEVAVEAHRHRPQDPRLTGQARRMILNGAYLVEEGQADRFSTTVQAAAAEHRDLVVELTGPWPPYSFAVAEQGDES